MKLKQGSNVISPELKSKILSEILKEGSSITKIAKSYNLSAKRLYNWRSAHNKSQIKLEGDYNKSNFQGNFVELQPVDMLSSNKGLVRSNISQISLKLNDITLSIEGNLSRNSLMKILEVIELC